MDSVLGALVLVLQVACRQTQRLFSFHRLEAAGDAPTLSKEQKGPLLLQLYLGCSSLWLEAAQTRHEFLDLLKSPLYILTSW